LAERRRGRWCLKSEVSKLGDNRLSVEGAVEWR
jgi:hypothetical protein